MNEMPTCEEFGKLVRDAENTAACIPEAMEYGDDDDILAAEAEKQKAHGSALAAYTAQAARIAELEAESVRLMQIGRDLEAASQEQFDAIECVEMELTQAHKHIAKLEAELARWRRNYPTSAAWEHALLPKEATDD